MQRWLVVVRMSPRKSPKSPFSGNAGPENPRSPFRGAGIPGKVSGGGAGCDLFGMEREAPQARERKEAAALVADELASIVRFAYLRNAAYLPQIECWICLLISYSVGG